MSCGRLYFYVAKVMRLTWAPALFYMAAALNLAALVLMGVAPLMLFCAAASIRALLSKPRG